MRILCITGTLGTGKSTVAAESGPLLRAHGEPYAIIDLDWLGWVWAPGVHSHDDLIVRNLEAIWPNFEAAGVRSLVVARALLDETLISGLWRAFPTAEIATVMLTASPEIIEQRLHLRDSGDTLREHLDETSSMTPQVARAAAGAPIVDTDGREPVDIARAVLRAAGWLPEGVSRRDAGR